MQIPKFRNIATVITVAAFCGTQLFISSLVQAAANPRPGRTKNDVPVAGQLTVIGSVTINDKKALNGTSIFNNSQIRVACSKGNNAIVNLGRLGRVELNPGSQLVLRFSEGLISGDLIQGNILVNTPAGVKVSINTSDGVTATDGKDASITPVGTQRGVRCVPMIASVSSQTPSALSSGAWMALMLGAGGAAIGAIMATGQEPVSFTRVP